MDEFVSNLDALHHIQQNVLRELTYQQVASHSELLPDGMSGNAFNYHLNFLVKHRLVQKSGRGYTLSPLGRLVVESMSLDSKRFKLRPTVGVLLLLTHDSGKVLTYRSSRQPLIGWAGLPFGKLRIGEDYQETSKRMISRRGIVPDEVKDLRAIAPFNIRYEEGGRLVCHRTGQIWGAVYTGRAHSSETANGASVWLDDDSPSVEEAVLARAGELNDVTISVG